MEPRRIPFIEVSGGPRERGRQYGEATRSQISEAVAYYAETFATVKNIGWDRVCDQSTAWLPLIEDYIPDILPEVRGIAEGANRTFEEILALNCRGEMSSRGAPLVSEDGCSSFAITPEAAGDGHVYCGQNWDWRPRTSDLVVMLRIRQSGKPTIIMQTEAGQVGRQGANSAGIALNANGLAGRSSTTLGVPVPYVRRKVLDSWNMHDALTAVLDVRQAFAVNVLLAHRDGFVIDLETTPTGHGYIYPDRGLLVHANHYMALGPVAATHPHSPLSISSLYRVPRIRQALEGCRAVSEPSAIREIVAAALRDHFGAPNSVCGHADAGCDEQHQYQTIASSIVDLASGSYYVAGGTPCQTEYECLSCNLYDGPDAPHAARG